MLAQTSIFIGADVTAYGVVYPDDKNVKAPRLPLLEPEVYERLDKFVAETHAKHPRKMLEVETEIYHEDPTAPVLTEGVYRVCTLRQKKGLGKKKG